MNPVDILKLNPQQHFTNNIRTVEAELFRTGGRRAEGGAYVKIPSLTSQRTDTHKMTDTSPQSASV